jgi:hypothetical protein
MEVFFSDGAADLTSAMNWGADARPIAAYPRCLLDPTVPMSSMATLVLALALGSKDQAQAAIAVDALVQTQLEARLDAPLLAATVRDLSRIYMVDNARYAKSLRAARRIDAKISAVAVDILCGVLQANSAAPLRDTNAILELLLEITIADDRKLSAHSRGTLEQLAVTGKGNSLRNRLLERA